MGICTSTPVIQVPRVNKKVSQIAEDVGRMINRSRMYSSYGVHIKSLKSETVKRVSCLAQKSNRNARSRTEEFRAQLHQERSI